MVHGTIAYFIERARCTRRVSLLTLICGVALFAGLMLTQLRPFRALTRNIDTARFGFEGRNQYVRRIILQSHQGPSPLLSDLGKVQPKSGGEGDAASRGHRPGTPVVKMPVELGDGLSNVAPRSVASYGAVPIVRSEDLVIDHMITPKYPEPLLDRNIEGKVTLQALVDTIGNVIQVQVLASTGEELFESAAQEAVMQCRFRPYRRGGGPASEVYAVFRFSFRIY